MLHLRVAFILYCFILLDLSNLHTIVFNGDHRALSGDNRNNRKAIINGYKSYNNTLIMKSTFN